MRWLLWLLVEVLERSCCLFHWVPGYACQLAMWSHNIDERFDVDCWSEDWVPGYAGKEAGNE